MGRGGGLTDLDELVLTCRTERARDYIQEAVVSYRAGAYRAGIITTWGVVTFDLIDKLRELAASGDAQAKSEIGSFDAVLLRMSQGDKTAIPAALQFEREILEKVRSRFQLLDEHQHEDMNRLFADRNRCAHPTFEVSGATYQPSAELARTHIRNAIVHVLQQPPVQGKAAIEAVIGQVRSRFFPQDRNLVKQVLAKQIGRARPALIKGLVDRLIWDMFEGSRAYSDENGVNALRALLDLHRADAEPRVQTQVAKAIMNTQDDKLPIACALVANLPESWEGLDEAQKDKFKRFLAEGNIYLVSHLIKDSLDKEVLREIACERIEKLDAPSLQQVVAVGVRQEAVNRAVELFASCKSYASANFTSSSLILPLIEHLNSDHVTMIIRSPIERNSDLRYAGGMVPFVEAIRKHKIMPTSEIDDLLQANGFEYLLDDD